MSGIGKSNQFSIERFLAEMIKIIHEPKIAPLKSTSFQIHFCTFSIKRLVCKHGH